MIAQPLCTFQTFGKPQLRWVQSRTIKMPDDDPQGRDPFSVRVANLGVLMKNQVMPDARFALMGLLHYLLFNSGNVSACELIHNVQCWIKI